MKATPRHARRATSSNAAVLRQAQATIDRYGPRFARTPTSATTKVEAYLQSVPVHRSPSEARTTVIRVRSSYAIKHAARIAAKAKAKADAAAFLAKNAAWGNTAAEARDGMERIRKMRTTLRLRGTPTDDKPDRIEAFVLHHLRTYLNGEPSRWMFDDTLNIVLDYVEGKRVLDGTCSDVQCFIAHEAAKHYGKQG